jgi:hypothetical protein
MFFPSIFALVAPALLTYTIAVPDVQQGRTHASEQFFQQAYANIGISAVHFDYTPAARSLAYSNQGVYDAEMARADNLTPKYENLRKVPFKLGTISFHVYQLAQQTTEPLKKNYLIALRGAKTNDQLQSPKGEVTYVDSIAQGLKLLATSRYRGFVSFCGLTENIAHKLGIPIVRYHTPIAEKAVYHFIHKSHSKLIEPLVQSFRQLTEAGKNPIKNMLECPQLNNVSLNLASPVSG